MDLIQIFQYEGVEVRTQTDEQGNTLFCASDVCKVLGYANGPDAVAKHCNQKGIAKRDTLTKGGNQLLTYLNEGNIYRLVAKSQITGADKFESWIFDEVLPTIRKHGMYATAPTIDSMIANPDFAIELLQKLKLEREAKQQLKTQVGELAPKADCYDRFMSSDEAMPMEICAKILSERKGNTIGRNTLFSFLREKGILQHGEKNHNVPYQSYIDRGYFKIIANVWTDPETSKEHLRFETLVYPKGVDYIHKVLSMPQAAV